MGRYEVHRTDGNAAALYDFMEAHGATVIKAGPLDAIVIYAGRMVLVDPKGSEKTPIQPKQAKLLREWPDLCFLLYSDDDCAALLKRMRHE